MGASPFAKAMGDRPHFAKAMAGRPEIQNDLFAFIEFLWYNIVR